MSYNNQWNYYGGHPSAQQGQFPSQSWQQQQMYSQQQFMLQQQGMPYPSGPIYQQQQQQPIGGYMYYQPHPQAGFQGANMVHAGPVPNLGQTHSHSVGPVPNPGQAHSHSVGPVPMLSQQQMLLEQQRKSELEEQKRKEIEIQKRKLQNISVKNPPSAINSLENLIGFDPSKTHKSPSPKVATPSPKTTPKREAPPTTALSNEAIVTQVAAVVVSTQPPVTPATIAKPTGPSIDQLLMKSMDKIDITTSKPVKKSDFKDERMGGVKASPLRQSKVYVQSTKARAWGSGNTDELSGLFHVPGAPQPTPLTAEGATSPSSSGVRATSPEDGFGEFHSGVTVATTRGPRPLLYMATPATKSPQLVHSVQGQTPLMATGDGGTSHGSLPRWLMSPSSLPPIYDKVYQKCRIPNSELTDTHLLFPLLVSSGLDRSALRDLWSLANKTVSGQLTRDELNVLLALIGMTQSLGRPAVLNDLTLTPPVPHLNELSSPPPSDDDFGEFQGTTASSVTPPTFNMAPPTSEISPLVSVAPPTLGVSPLLPTSATPSTDKYSVFKSELSNEIKSHDLYSTLEGSSTQGTMDSTLKDDPYSALRFDSTHNIMDSTQSTMDSTQNSTLKDDPYSALRFDSTQNIMDSTQSTMDSTLKDDPYSALRLDSTQSTISSTLNNNPLILNSTHNPMDSALKDDPYSAFKMDSVHTLISTSASLTHSPSPNPPSLDGWADFTSFGDGNHGNDEDEFTWVTATMVTTATTSSTSATTSTQYRPTSSPPLPLYSPISSGSTTSSPDHAGKCLPMSAIWTKCVTECHSLLLQSLNVLAEIKDQDVLAEIINSDEGQAKLKGLVEVYRFAKRIHTTSRGPGKRFMSTTRGESLTKLMLDMKNTWNSIFDLFPKDKMDQLTNSMMSPSNAPTDEDTNKCHLCLLPSNIFISPLVTIDGRSEQYTIPTHTVNGRLFHVQCVNFWTIGMNMDTELIPI